LEQFKTNVAAAVDSAGSADTANNDVLAQIEKLSELNSKGILTDEEFVQKKADLLARL
jgi:hypothetical protein